MKIKIISKTVPGYDIGILEKEVNNFIKDKDIVDIKFKQYLVPTIGNKATFLIMYK